MAWKRSKSSKNQFGKKVDIEGNEIKNFKIWYKNNPNRLYFDSKFEWKIYQLFKEEKLNFKFHPETRTVVEGFKSWALSKGKEIKLFRSTVRPITYTSDFAIYCNDGTTIFVEAKGFFHNDARLRYKLFQKTLDKKEISVLVFDGKESLKEAKALIKIIKSKFGGSTGKTILNDSKDEEEKIKL